MIASKEFVIKTMVSLLATAKKKYSQNFLIDSQTVINAVNSLNKDVAQVVEIGPGLGALTEQILNQNFYLDAYEIDENMVNHLLNHFNKNAHRTGRNRRIRLPRWASYQYLRRAL